MLINALLVEAFIDAGKQLKSQWAAASFMKNEACFILDDAAIAPLIPRIIYTITPEIITPRDRTCGDPVQVHGHHHIQPPRPCVVNLQPLLMRKRNVYIYALE